MKIKFKILGIAAIVAAGCLVGISRFQTTEQAALTLANVEALTNGEDTVKYDKCCTDDADLNCIPNYMGLIPGRPKEC